MKLSTGQDVKAGDIVRGRFSKSLALLTAVVIGVKETPIANALVAYMVAKPQRRYGDEADVVFTPDAIAEVLLETEVAQLELVYREGELAPMSVRQAAVAEFQAGAALAGIDQLFPDDGSESARRGYMGMRQVIEALPAEIPPKPPIEVVPMELTPAEEREALRARILSDLPMTAIEGGADDTPPTVRVIGYAALGLTCTSRETLAEAILNTKTRQEIVEALLAVPIVPLPPAVPAEIPSNEGVPVTPNTDKNTPPPVDNVHVAPGAEQFAEPPAPTREPAPAHGLSAEEIGDTAPSA